MPPKEKPGANAKKESGKAKKADNAAKKAEEAAAAAEKKTAAEWDDGAKGKKSKDQEKEEKKKADAARKAETARLLAEEEAANAAKPKPAASKASKKSGSGAASKTNVPAGPGAIAAGGGLPDAQGKEKAAEVEEEHKADEPTEFAATGLDDALDLLSLVNAKTDKASVGQAATGIEQHPERRFKAAFEAYKDRELPELKKDRPGMRLQQYQEILFKQFQKSPDNPFNQHTVAFDATKEEKVDALKRQKEITTSRLAVQKT